MHANTTALRASSGHLIAFLDDRVSLARQRTNAPLQMFERLGARTAISPIQQLHSVQHRHRRRRQLVEAADTPGCDTVGLHAVYGLQLALLEFLGEFGLGTVVGSRRAAA